MMIHLVEVPASHSFTEGAELLAKKIARGGVVDVGEWQAIRNGELPQTKTVEIMGVVFTYWVPDSTAHLQKDVDPNLPWAEDHFLERVSGDPFNPPPSHVNWPYAQHDNSEHRKTGVFSHTYPERIWPKFANRGVSSREAERLSLQPTHGVRFRYGDFDDLLQLLAQRRHTRQAYLPIWFPEDLAAANEQGERVPCTLGYHFLIRNDRLYCTYHIRSCDFFRHFRDDVYMACRLMQWIGEQINAAPAQLTMNIGSLHIFEAELQVLQAQIREQQDELLTGWY